MFSSRKPRPLAVVADSPGRGDRGDRGDRDDRDGGVPGTPAAPIAEQALAYVDELYGLARHLCSTPSDAEDIVQETFARALGGVARLTPGSNLRAWLFRILRNCFIDQARRKKIVLEISDDTVGDRSAHEVWDAQSLDQLRYLAAADLERALATLPHELRMIVLLDAQGFTEAEIADIARCAQGTVKSRLSRARARLRSVLHGGAPGDGGGA
ncbi:MAG TPA: sigma-70 family RNA polymerase sigma factor [Kofleriaceae bacterium]|nr:sigma-70 family RNA polymerase sigma factor [Kofleriaceae bacterium]